MPSTNLPPEIEALRELDGAVVVVDNEGLVVLMNNAAEKLFDVEETDLAGEFVELVVPSNKRWGHQAYRRGYQVEPNDREMDPGLEPELERPDGTLIPIQIRLQPFQIDGKLFTAAHVTER